RPGPDERASASDVLEHDRDVDAPMERPVRLEPARSLLQLALATPAVAPARVLPGDGDMDQPPEELALRPRAIAPLRLRLLVRLQVGARADKMEAWFEPHGGIIRVRERC